MQGPLQRTWRRCCPQRRSTARWRVSASQRPPPLPPCRRGGATRGTRPSATLRKCSTSACCRDRCPAAACGPPQPLRRRRAVPRRRGALAERRRRHRRRQCRRRQRRRPRRSRSLRLRWAARQPPRRRRRPLPRAWRRNPCSRRSNGARASPPSSATSSGPIPSARPAPRLPRASTSPLVAQPLPPHRSGLPRQHLKQMQPVDWDLYSVRSCRSSWTLIRTWPRLRRRKQSCCRTTRSAGWPPGPRTRSFCGALQPRQLLCNQSPTKLRACVPPHQRI
mmetsp:Transcript_18258/g.70557  ORF Transcript_18258/g.70557 Transcript_18258/m.70557 type:complete len:278 (-) Transcript_18258:1038-1871(-)